MEQLAALTLTGGDSEDAFVVFYFIFRSSEFDIFIERPWVLRHTPANASARGGGGRERERESKRHRRWT